MRTLKLKKFKMVDHGMQDDSELGEGASCPYNGEYRHRLTMNGHTKQKVISKILEGLVYNFMYVEIDVSGVEASIKQLITIDDTPVCVEDTINPLEDTLMISRPTCENLSVDSFSKVYVDQLDICQKCKKRFWISILYTLDGNTEKKKEKTNER